MLKKLRLGNDMNMKDISKIELKGKDIQASTEQEEQHNSVIFLRVTNLRNGDTLKITFK